MIYKGITEIIEILWESPGGDGERICLSWVMAPLDSGAESTG